MGQLLDAMDDACRVTHGASIHSLYITIPHRTLPRLASAELYPPVAAERDTYIAGDHDMHACIPLVDAVDWGGHQRHAVREIAEAALAEIRAFANPRE